MKPFSGVKLSPEVAKLADQDEHTKRLFVTGFCKFPGIFWTRDTFEGPNRAYRNPMVVLRIVSGDSEAAKLFLDSPTEPETVEQATPSTQMSPDGKEVFGTAEKLLSVSHFP